MSTASSWALLHTATQPQVRHVALSAAASGEEEAGEERVLAAEPQRVTHAGLLVTCRCPDVEMWPFPFQGRGEYSLL